MESIGDKLFRIISNTRSILFLQGEIAQLTYQSFHKYIENINTMQEQQINVTFPVGFRPDNTTIDTTRSYSKSDLIKMYEILSVNQLPINGIVQLVTATEALLGDILREVLIAFPKKISNKKKLDFELVLEAKSLEEIKLNLVYILLNELSYKSPKEYSEEFDRYVGINLFEQPAFHRYIELKATRDIYIHNQGIANSIYVNKAGTSARVKAGMPLPVTIQYFLQSYECCLQITEILEEALNSTWPSLEYQKSKTNTIEQQKEQVIEQTIANSDMITQSSGNQKKASKTNKKVKVQLNKTSFNKKKRPT